ncbi:MAG: ribosomal protein S18-alanine N-acetyltransferase [Candidatus Hydrogenedentes bacterium]|nr:ribosomal protein S18-alanine N-acetyltransferase [Candidatus Hydrogenedentota bacterium]
MATPSAPGIDASALRFERIQKHHLPAVLPIEHEAYPDPWTQGMFHQEIQNAASHFYLAFLDDTLVAYGGFWMILEEVHITRLTVAPEYRMQGLGRHLMDYLEARGAAAGGRIIRLEVRESNAAARALYRGAGYQEAGVRRNYYAATGEDAIVMVKELAT